MEDAAASEHPLAELQEFLDLGALLLAQVVLQRGVGGCSDLAFALCERSDVLFVIGVGESALQLDQQGLETDPQLQSRLAVPAGVEIGAGTQ